jgi:DNA-directed RNA polymerase subunit RPC12/RpoP
MFGLGRRNRQQVAEPVEHAGRQLTCPHCGHDRFWRRRTMLNSLARTFLGSDWRDPSALTFICERCGRIEWFAFPRRE